MRKMIRSALGLVVATALVVTGCSQQDNPVGLIPGQRGGVSFDEAYGTALSGSVAPTDSIPAAGQVSVGETVVRMLARDVPLSAPIQVSKLIGVEGGKLEIPEAGLRIHIPNGALSQATQITVTALAGNGVAYDFQPHGLVFQKPLVAVQSFRLAGVTIPPLGGGYFSDASYLNQATLTARVRERMPSEVEVLNKKVKFNIPHFSGYLLSID